MYLGGKEGQTDFDSYFMTPPPFLQILKKRAEEVKYYKLILMLKQLFMNIPLVENLSKYWFCQICVGSC